VGWRWRRSSFRTRKVVRSQWDVPWCVGVQRIVCFVGRSVDRFMVVGPAEMGSRGRACLDKLLYNVLSI
jgi:hypothetical protein